MSSGSFSPTHTRKKEENKRASIPKHSWDVLTRSSNREVRIRVPFFSVVYFSRGTLPRGKKKHYWGDLAKIKVCRRFKLKLEGLQDRRNYYHPTATLFRRRFWTSKQKAAGRKPVASPILGKIKWVALLVLELKSTPYLAS